MELPRDQTKRDATYRGIIRDAELPSRSDRRERFRRMRQLFLTGTDGADRAKFNGLKEWSSLSSSLIYAQENLQFGLTTPPYYGDKWDQELAIAREELHRLWFDGASAPVASMAVQQAHYADTAIVKLFISRNEPTLDVVSDPS